MLLSRTAAAALGGWKPISDRLISARFQSRHAKIRIIQIYAPTEESEDEITDEFYDRMQEEIDATPLHDILLVIGDYNAKVDSNRDGFENVIGPYASSSNTNENGERMRSFCLANSLCMGNTFFQHHDIHKKTLRYPDGSSLNEIDFVCVSKRWRSSLLGVKVQRGADIGSDHYLLLAKCRLRLKKLPKKQQRSRLFDIATLLI